MPDLTAVECRSNGGQTAAASQTCRIAYLPRRMLFILQAACNTGFPCQILSARRAGISTSIIPYRQISYIHISINIHIVNRRTAIMHCNLKVQYRRNQAESDRRSTEPVLSFRHSRIRKFPICRNPDPLQVCSDTDLLRPSQYRNFMPTFDAASVPIPLFPILASSRRFFFHSFRICRFHSLLLSSPFPILL